MKPRVLFVGRTSYRLPLDEGLGRKWDALGERMGLRVLASGSGSDPRFHLVGPRRLDGPRFYAGLPARVARELRRFDPDVVIAESPYEAVAVELARRLTGSRAKLVAEVHGDWRVSTRLYGSRARRLVAPLGDRLAGLALRRADAHRAISPFTASLLREQGLEPARVFATYSDLGAFEGPASPPPPGRQALFVGVLERYKNVEGLAAAWRLVVERVPGARLHVVGSGTQVGVAEALAAAGARWDERLEPGQLAAALDESRVLLLPSASEGLGRVILEAFLRGRPVVATRVGGIPDVVEHEVSGLLVPPGDMEALAEAIERVLTDDQLAARLGAAARERVRPWLATLEEYADNVRAVVDAALAGSGPVSGPRLLLVSRTRYRLPVAPHLQPKFDALAERFDLRVLGTSATGRSQDDGRFRLVGRLPVLDGVLFYLLLPLRVRRLARRFRPDAIIVQSPYEAAFVHLARTPARVVVELHGDWRTATRDYGSPLRRLLSPLADAVARYGLRSGDAVRTVSAFTSGLAREAGCEPVGEFVTYSDVSAFRGPVVEVPEAARVLFVGVLERYKNVEGLAEAWRLVAERLPGSELHLVGSGTQVEVVERLVADGARWDSRLEPSGVAAALDLSRALVLPSVSEGLPRVAIEAFLRGRAVVGTRAGGIPDIVEDGVTGLLVPPGDTAALAAAIERILRDRELAVRLGAAARERAPAWVATPAEYADGVRAVVDTALRG